MFEKEGERKKRRVEGKVVKTFFTTFPSHLLSSPHIPSPSIQYLGRANLVIVSWYGDNYLCEEMCTKKLRLIPDDLLAIEKVKEFLEQSILLLWMKEWLAYSHWYYGSSK